MIVHDPLPPTPRTDLGVEETSKAGGVAAMDDLSLSLSLSLPPDVTLQPDKVTPRAPAAGEDAAGRLTVRNFPDRAGAFLGWRSRLLVRMT